jgi:hypothetical protein
LTIDLNNVAHELARKVRRPLDQHQADALISFGFNCGLGGCPTLFKLLNAGLYDQVPGQLLRFVHGANSGKSLSGLVARRHDEAALFATGTAPAVAPQTRPVDGSEDMPQTVKPRRGPLAPVIQGRTFWGAITAGIVSAGSYIGALPEFLRHALDGGTAALAPAQPFLDYAGISGRKEWLLLATVIGLGMVVYARCNAAIEEKIG